MNSLDGPAAATEQEQAQFFDQLLGGFLAASARTGEIVHEYRLAGTSVRLRFAGDALVPTIVPGLAKTMSQLATGPVCEVLLWDSESSGVPLPPPPRPWIDFTRRGNIWGFDSARYRSAYHWGEGSINAMDRETQQAVFWAPTNRHMPIWVLASPLRSILHWWMELNGRQLAHAASVGCDGRGVMIPGRGGSGKSSTSLACLLAGMDFVADDYLALALEPEPRTYRLYSTAKLDAASLKLHPELASRCRTVHQPGFEKVVLFLEDGYRDQLKDSLRLDLALKPHISGMPETVLGKAEALEIERAVACETLGHLPHAGDRTVEFLNRLSREVPRAAIHLGTERGRIPAVVQHALASRIKGELPSGGCAKIRPFLSVVVHFYREDREELRALATAVEVQDYPRTEFIVVASGPASAMIDEVARLPGTVRFFSYPEPVVNAEAWNRGVRESFAELLFLIEPGDRFPEGALDALASASETDSEAAWVRGRSSGDGDEWFGSLRAALIRKSAFRDCGLFPTGAFFQGREHQSWIQRVQARGLTGRAIETSTLDVAAGRKSDRYLLRPNLSFVKERLALRQGKKLE